jgi:hypothetical protein
MADLDNVGSHPDPASTPTGRLRRPRRWVILTVAGALVASVAVGCAVAWANHALSSSWALGVIIGETTFAYIVCTAWVRTADKYDPEIARVNDAQSIEVTWYNQAAAGAFGDLISAFGLTILFLLATPFDPETGLVLAVVMEFGTVDMTVRLVLLKRRDG